MTMDVAEKGSAQRHDGNQYGSAHHSDSQHHGILNGQHHDSPNDDKPDPSLYNDEEKPPVLATLATAAIAEGEPTPAAISLSQVGPPPDGGLRAWLTVLGSFFAVFTQFGLGASCGSGADASELIRRLPGVL